MSHVRLPSARRLAGLGILTLAALGLAVGTASPAGASGASAAVGGIVDAGGPNAIPNSYIVVFKDSAVKSHGLGALTSTKSAKAAAKVERRYTAALHGFAGTMSEAEARKLAADPTVAYVAQNHRVQLFADQANPPSWGLDRVDQRDLPLNNNYHYDVTASNVTAYIIDTGIRTTHADFGGRAVWGTNTADANNTDCNGHGTHVAGTVGGAQYGVAKGVNLVAVKVLNCAGSGTSAGVAAGIDWVTGQHAAGAPAVANMSLGGGADTALDTAVRNSIADGVTYAIAAGNDNANACNYSPARVTEAITVNASDSNDARATFSNFGTCTDIFAPGVNITSSWNTNDTATNTISGTSMATPHVAGAAALYLAANPSASPATVQQALKDNATLNKITNPGTGSPNRLLYTLSATGNPAVSNPGNRTGTVGVATSLQMSASGGTPPYTWSATGLPPGLSINSSSGLISGTPTTAGTFSVTVTAQDTAAGTGSTSFTWTINPPGGGCGSPGQKLGNPGFETGTAPWTATAGVIGQNGPAEPAHSGIRNAWMDGYGTTHTDTLSQTVTIPAGCTASTLSFWLHIDSAETTTTTQFDKLTVQLGGTTLATYSNLNKAAGYSQKSFNVGAFAGQTVTLKFTGTEDISLQTSFVLDDTALNAG